MNLTPIDKFGNYWVKREDGAGFTSLDYPSGSKVRQYAAMAQPNTPMIVGCASNSAMQIYVAAAAKQAGVPGIIYVPKSKTPTDATRYAIEMGAEINEVYPGYMNVLRSRAKVRAKALGKVVRWDVKGAVADAAAQVVNIPPEVKRIVIATGSGLTAAGVLAGLKLIGSKMPVVAIAVSNLAEHDTICKQANELFGGVLPLPPFTLIQHPKKYSDYMVRRLPDGTPLDPFYAAKAFDYLQEGDLLWTPGLRPVRAMPLECRQQFSDWSGFP